MSNKIATDISIFATAYFNKQRPFEIMQNGRMVKKPVFPNTMTVRKSGQNFQTRVQRDKITSNILAAVTEKPLFIEGDDYRVGMYYGDVYEIPDKKYHLFRVTREPVKQLILPDPITQMTSYIKLMIQSPNNRINNIQISRRGTWQEDIEVTEQKIKSLLGTMPTLVDNATEGLETYIRAYYAMQKIQSVGGNKKNTFRILPKY